MPHAEYLSENKTFQALEQGAVLLTVNRRWSRSLQQRYSSHQSFMGRGVWEAPDIMPLNSWIMRCMQEVTYLDPDSSHPQPISQDQEMALWKDITRNSAHSRGLLHLDETARQVSRAWMLFVQWNLKEYLDPLEWSSLDHQAFLDWSGTFRDLTHSRGWIEEARQPEYVAWMFNKGHLPCPAQVALAGLDNLNPVQTHILDVLQGLGCRITRLQLTPECSSKHLVTLLDQEHEIRTCALWARTRLQEEPEQSIGVVILSNWAVP